jgi:hypothetical protein
MPRGLRKVSTDKNDVQHIVDHAVEGNANIFIGKAQAKSKIGFVMLFGANFDAVLSKFEFTMADMRVLFCVLSKMAFGNQLSIKQSGIAKELDVHKSNVSKSWKKLSDSGIFMCDAHGNEFMNFDLFLKGKPDNATETFAEQAALSHAAMIANDVKTVIPFPKFVKKKLTDEQEAKVYEREQKKVIRKRARASAEIQFSKEMRLKSGVKKDLQDVAFP